MPELPEVENTTAYLRQKILGCTISDVEVNWPRLVATHAVADFRNEITSKKISNVHRRGKFIIFNLDSDRSSSSLYLFAHMRMSGSFDVVSSKATRSKHDHVVFRCNNNREVRFHDPRKFGRFFLVSDPALVIGKLGPEPLSDTFKVDQLFEIVRSRNTSIKSLLLDQTSLAGVGNIYADESLWSSGIHPLARTQRLHPDRVAKLYRSIRTILTKAIGSGGTDNGDGVVEGGMYQPKVYGRAGMPCPRCKGVLARTLVSQRGTTFCKVCQKR